MNRRSLKYFIEVAKAGSIAAAADKVHVAGSALSRTITSLENEIGVPLFERRSHGMELTAEGKLLAHHVRRLNFEEEQILQQIRGWHSRLEGTIRIATSQGLASYLLPNLAYLFQKKYPAVTFEIQAVSPHEISRQVGNGEIDIGIGFSSQAHVGAEIVDSRPFRTCAIVSPKHPIASLSSVNLQQILPYPVATSPGTTVRQILDLQSRLNGIKLNIVYESQHSAGLFNYSSISGAVTFSAAISAHHWISQGLLVAVPMQNEEAFTRIFDIQTMKDRTLPLFISKWISFLLDELRSFS